jgi:hypothetical protein
MTAEVSSIVLPIVGSADEFHCDAVRRLVRSGPAICSAPSQAESLAAGSVRQKGAR